jgi:uncharacterized membrane protein
VPNIGLVELLLIIVEIALFVAIVAATVVVFARAVRHKTPPTTPTHDPAMDTLRTRLANGEIDEPEYERLRSTLQRH